MALASLPTGRSSSSTRKRRRTRRPLDFKESSPGSAAPFPWLTRAGGAPFVPPQPPPEQFDDQYGYVTEEEEETSDSTARSRSMRW
jgi:hypothetical protein